MLFHVHYTHVHWFFSLIFFGGTEVPIVFIFSGGPSEGSLQEVPSQMAAHLRTGNALYAGEIAGPEPRTAVSQSGVATNEPPLLPMSHHCSLMSHHVHCSHVICYILVLSSDANSGATFCC